MPATILRGQRAHGDNAIRAISFVTCAILMSPRRKNAPFVLKSSHPYPAIRGSDSRLSVLAGDHIVAGDDLYGGTSRLLAQVAPNLGLEVTHVDTTDVQ